MRVGIRLLHLPGTNRIIITLKIYRGTVSCTKPFYKQKLVVSKLPAGLAHAGDLALVSQLTEADTANAKLTKVGMWSAADLASIVLTSRELLFLLLLEFH